VFRVKCIDNWVISQRRERAPATCPACRVEIIGVVPQATNDKDRRDRLREDNKNARELRIYSMDRPTQERVTELERLCVAQHIFQDDHMNRYNTMYTEKAKDCTDAILIELKYMEVATDGEHTCDDFVRMSKKEKSGWIGDQRDSAVSVTDELDPKSKTWHAWNAS
jgi:hypothetical protein